MEFIKLCIFVVWVASVMWLTARKGVEAFNREFSGLVLSMAACFYGMIDGYTLALILLTYMGVRTYQKNQEAKIQP